jgi:hypothetical protein
MYDIMSSHLWCRPAPANSGSDGIDDLDRPARQRTLTLEPAHERRLLAVEEVLEAVALAWGEARVRELGRATRPGVVT